MEDIKQKIINEVKRIEEDSLFSSKGHFFAARRWNNLHLMLGIPAIVFAAISGTLSFSGSVKPDIFAGGLSLLVAILAALITFLNPNEKTNLHHKAGNSYDALKNSARIFSNIGINTPATDEKLYDQVRDLNSIRTDLNQSSPGIPQFAYKQAKRSIDLGEADYHIDRKEKGRL